MALTEQRREMLDEPAVRVRLELADRGDAATLARIQQQAFADDVHLYGKGPPGFDSPPAQLRAMRMATYYKILVGHEIAGGLIVRARDQAAGHYYLVRMFLAPGFQNQGIGGLAFRMLEEKYLGASKWTLDTPYRSDRNHRFYEMLGFAKVGQSDPAQHADMPDKNFHLVLFEKNYHRPGPAS